MLQGNLEETFEFGRMYERGILVNKTSEMATDCYRKTANNGDTSAIVAFGEIV